MEIMQTTGIVDNKTSTFYQRIFTDAADPRTNDWFLVGSPIPIALILFSYLYFVKVCGPKYMKDKKPYDLKRIMLVYNFLQVGFNTLLFHEAVGIWSNYNWHCQPMDTSYSPLATKVMRGSYMYFLNKIMDLIDTGFFVLRKKDKQITFLHLYHHTMMAFIGWLVVKYFPGGHATFTGLLNSFVHMLLYLYYFLAALGLDNQKYLWWKKYLTRVQLIQFCLVLIHDSQLLVFDCNYPKWTVLLTLPNAIFFFYLFNEFYKNSYTTEKEKQQHNNAENGTSEDAKIK